MSSYASMIRTELDALGGEATQIDPRHIEGYMRLECGTLDSLSRECFWVEVRMAVACVVYDGADNAENLARSYGL